MNRFLALLVLSLLVLSACAQQGRQSWKAEPPSWFSGMKDNSWQIIFSGSGISKYKVTAKGAEILETTRFENPDYIAVVVSVKKIPKSGFITFWFEQGKEMERFDYLILPKTHKPVGLTPNDLIYLIMPDRFVNGDLRNDSVPDMNEMKVDRSHIISRHGGDLRGIIDHLGYIEELGATTLWLNPVLENNEPRESYHGYAMTDLYRVDPRFGSNDLYFDLSRRLREKDMKLIMDVVYNHVGDKHPFMLSLPDSTWVHQWSEFTRTSYRAETLLDPYASESDRNQMSDGWFDKHMPDLNQSNPVVAKWLIDWSLWWIEMAGLQAYRIDTYAYPDQEFMATLNKRILEEYPGFTLFGETWVQGSPIQAWFTHQNGYAPPSYLQGVTDFQLYYAITEGLMEPFGWTDGLAKVELTLSHDVLYDDPFRNVTFLDNHDLSRFYSVVGEDFDKWKMGMGMLLTLRGIPCIYYGTEILMKNFANPDGHVRSDFPGGWPSDTINKFSPRGRLEKENEAFSFISGIAQWKKRNPWFGSSELTQFVPRDGVYVYFRYTEEHALMVIVNQNENMVDLDLQRFKERTMKAGFTMGQDILGESSYDLTGSTSLRPKSITMLHLR